VSTASARGGYDCLLLVSFGGPEGPDDVSPYLDRVLRGRRVPPERRREVEQHYLRFGGRSPINARNRELLAALGRELVAHDVDLPLYWGNRNWHPLLADTLSQMASDGRHRALAFVTSAYGSYSGCRQYREDVEGARAEVGAAAPRVDVLRRFYNHPGFVKANAARLLAARKALEAGAEPAVVFSAHSLPVAMAERSPYVEHLNETCRLVAEAAGLSAWTLAYQSRSGPPSQPWLEPDVCAHLRSLAADGVADVVLVPVGFVSDHMEVVYDLDTEAADVARSVGLRLVRAATAGTHPAFVGMIRELVLARLDPAARRRALGDAGPYPDVCPADCCPASA